MTEQTIEQELVDIGDEEEVFVPMNAVEQIMCLSQFCHDVLSQYGRAYGQELKAWPDLTKIEQQHIVGRVAHFMTYPDADAGAPHEACRLRIQLNGWSYGRKFDAARKTRPDLCYFSQLPPEQQACDFIIKGIVEGTFKEQ